MWVCGHCFWLSRCDSRIVGNSACFWRQVIEYTHTAPMRDARIGFGSILANSAGDLGQVEEATTQSEIAGR